MTAKEALQILSQAAALAPLNRQAHVAVQQAEEILRLAITPKPETEDAPPD